MYSKRGRFCSCKPHWCLSGVSLNGAIFDNCGFGGTIFAGTDLSVCSGLENVFIEAPCNIDFQTLRASRNLPKSFLLKLGLPELYIDYLPDFYEDALTLYSTFLSHSKENRDFARKLYEALIAKGVQVFFDEKELRPGDRLVNKISQGINYHDKTILICSEASLKSDWVDYELELVLKKEEALTEQTGEDTSLLIPITIDDHVYKWKNGKHLEVKGRYIGDFRGWENEAVFEKALNQLIEALNANRRERKPPNLLG